jgi:hypothetical protein
VCCSPDGTIFNLTKPSHLYDVLDKVLCHFCFKPKKVTDEVLKPANGRKSQMLISDIIVLKTALDAIPFLSKVLYSE